MCSLSEGSHCSPEALQTLLSPAVHHEGDALFRPLRDLFTVRQALEAAVGGVLRVLDEQLVQHRSFVGLGKVQSVWVIIGWERVVVHVGAVEEGEGRLRTLHRGLA